MSDDLPPIGFWSYTTSDDMSSRGRLSQLRRLLADELQQKVGRRNRVHVWQDANAIPHGASWQEEIHKGIDASSFFIPIVTPAFLESEWCCYEVARFRALEQQRGRNDLIFPLHYVDTEDMRPDEAHDPQILTLLRARQMFDFRRLRFANPEGEEVGLALDAFTDSIRGALRAGRRTLGGLAAPTISLPLVHTPVQTPVRTPPAPVGGPAPGVVHQDARDLPEMVLLEKGMYFRGIPPEESRLEGTDAEDDSARPVRPVIIAEPFWMGRTAVTRQQFAAFIGATGRPMPTHAFTYEGEVGTEWTEDYRSGRDWRYPGYEQTDQHPVVCVSHKDAEAYIDWLNQQTEVVPTHRTVWRLC